MLSHTKRDTRSLSSIPIISVNFRQLLLWHSLQSTRSRVCLFSPPLFGVLVPPETNLTVYSPPKHTQPYLLLTTTTLAAMRKAHFASAPSHVRFPVEVWEMIIGELDAKPQDLAVLARVCQTLYRLLCPSDTDAPMRLGPLRSRHISMSAADYHVLATLANDRAVANSVRKLKLRGPPALRHLAYEPMLMEEHNDSWWPLNLEGELNNWQLLCAVFQHMRNLESLVVSQPLVLRREQALFAGLERNCPNLTRLFLQLALPVTWDHDESTLEAPPVDLSVVSHSWLRPYPF